MRTISMDFEEQAERAVVVCYVCQSELLTILSSAEMVTHSELETEMTITIEPCAECLRRAVSDAERRCHLDVKGK